MFGTFAGERTGVSYKQTAKRIKNPKLIACERVDDDGLEVGSAS